MRFLMIVFSFAVLLPFATGGPVLAADGAQLFKDNCAACHMPDDPSAQMVAPPIAGVLMHYERAFPDRAEAIKAISAWAVKPEETSSVLPGALRRFGLMPAVDISPENARTIAEYITSQEFRPPMPMMGEGMGRGMMRGQGGQQ